eukprot:6033668-Pyramimonas_sp.AAC.1
MASKTRGKTEVIGMGDGCSKDVAFVRCYEPPIESHSVVQLAFRTLPWTKTASDIAFAIQPLPTP